MIQKHEKHRCYEAFKQCNDITTHRTVGQHIFSHLHPVSHVSAVHVVLVNGVMKGSLRGIICLFWKINQVLRLNVRKLACFSSK